MNFSRSIFRSHASSITHYELRLHVFLRCISFWKLHKIKCKCNLNTTPALYLNAGFFLVLHCCMTMKTLINSFSARVCGRSEMNDSLILTVQIQNVYFSSTEKHSATEDIADLCRKQLA